jgi:curved DNA-binding protein CbpA
VLGVGAGASRQDIVRAYRRAVQRAHPDTRPRDPHAVARFQALTDAYDLLTDAARRAGYDRTRPAAGPGSQPHPPSAKLRHSARGDQMRSTAHSPLVWAGPVHVEPPADAGQQEQGGAPADFEDPPVILWVQPGQAWRWLW